MKGGKVQGKNNTEVNRGVGVARRVAQCRRKDVHTVVEGVGRRIERREESRRDQKRKELEEEEEKRI